MNACASGHVPSVGDGLLADHGGLALAELCDDKHVFFESANDAVMFLTPDAARGACLVAAARRRAIVDVACAQMGEDGLFKEAERRRFRPADFSLEALRVSNAAAAAFVAEVEPRCCAYSLRWERWGGELETNEA